MKNSGLAPIVLFVYNRPEYTRQTLEHLKQNFLADLSELFIYSDGPKAHSAEETLIKISEVREIIRQVKWCKKVHIIESPSNNGLANSVIKGVTEIVNEFGRVIVLEDDLLTSIHFLEYMNEGLNRFAKIKEVFTIVGYTPPIKTSFKNKAVFLPLSSTWGWGTWSRAWKYFEKDPNDYVILKADKEKRREFNLDNSYPYNDMLIKQMEVGSNSWGILWWWSVFKQNGIGVFPDRSLIANIGFGEDATHTVGKIENLNKYWLKDYQINHFPEIIDINQDFYSLVKSYYKTLNKKSLKLLIINKLCKIFDLIKRGNK